jgi:hypothetical protein
MKRRAGNFSLTMTAYLCRPLDLSLFCISYEPREEPGGDDRVLPFSFSRHTPSTEFRLKLTDSAPIMLPVGWGLVRQPR